MEIIKRHRTSRLQDLYQPAASVAEHSDSATNPHLQQAPFGAREGKRFILQLHYQAILSDRPIGDHRICYLDETCNIGPFDVVDIAIVLSAIPDAFVMDTGHDAL